MLIERFGVSCRPLTAGALVAALAGCIGSAAQSPLALPAGPASKPGLPAAAGDLIYVLDNRSENVYQYSYATRKRLEAIKGSFHDVLTMCVDTAQDVFVVDDAIQSIYEYSHDGKAIKTLVDFFGFPSACSVDPATGNLAVTNYALSGSPGSVVIFPHVTGRPRSYDIPNMSEIFFPAYDDKGNLFLDGYSVHLGSPVLSELHKGGKTFEQLAMSPKIASVFGMQWDGKYLAICDTGRHPNEIDRFSISRSSATKVSSAILKDDDGVYQFFIAAVGGKSVILATNPASHKLYAWRYPLGGNPIFSIAGFSRPLAAVISRSTP